MEKYKEKTLGIEQWQYAEKVDFVQVIELKVKGYRFRENSQGAKTNLTGTVTYQTCNDHECLPPKTERFDIAIGFQPLAISEKGNRVNAKITGNEVQT